MPNVIRQQVRALLMLSSMVFLILSLGCAEKVDLAAETKTLNDHVAKVQTAINDSNFPEFVSLFMSDAKITRPDSSIFEGTEAIEGWAREAFGNYTFESRLASEKLLIYPGAKKAFDRGIYHLNRTPKDGGNLEKESGWYRLFWYKQKDGTWRIYRLNWLKAPSASEDEDVF